MGIVRWLEILKIRIFFSKSDFNIYFMSYEQCNSYIIIIFVQDVNKNSSDRNHLHFISDNLPS